MALDTNIVGANLDANSRIKTTIGPAVDAASTGSIRIMSENDAGTVTGTPLLSSPETSPDYRLRVGMDSLLDYHVFSGSNAQFTGKHFFGNTTMTATQNGVQGFVTNAGNITTLSTNVMLRTYQAFAVFGAGVTYADMSVAFTAAAPTNTVLEFGFGLFATTTPFASSDGAVFRYSSLGMQGVLTFNSTETTVNLPFVPTINTFAKYTVTVSTEEVQFWVDDTLQGVLARSATNGDVWQPMKACLGFRHNIAASAASAAVSMKVMNYSVTLGDIQAPRLWSTAMAAMAGSGIQGQNNMTQGQTANYVNSTVPASATLSNTAAGYTNMGGQFQFAAVAGAETDYALFVYFVPAITTNGDNKSLVIRGVWIDTVNTGAAVATTATLLQWAIAVGSSAVSLATAEAANTKAPRRLALGFQSFAIADAIGKQAVPIDKNLDAPLVVNPGEFLHIILKMPLGTATASQVIRGVVGLNAYWE